MTTAALSTPAVAQVACLEEIITRNVTGFGFTNGTITDGTVRVLDGGKGNANWSFQVPDCELVIAYAHWHKWAKCPGSPTACFRNASGETCIYIEDCEFDDNVSGSSSAADTGPRMERITISGEYIRRQEQTG